MDKEPPLDETREERRLRHQLGQVARDVGAIIATTAVFLSMMGAVVVFIFRPYTTPFLELPKKLAELQIQLAKVQIDLAEVREPHLIEYAGPGFIVGPKVVERGGEFRILYNLRRNASCNTNVDRRWVNTATGSTVYTDTIRAVQAPVTQDFSTFTLTVQLPDSLGPGNWVYFPRVEPIDCGVYGAYNGAISEPFTIVDEG